MLLLTFLKSKSAVTPFVAPPSRTGRGRMPARRHRTPAPTTSWAGSA